MVFGRIGIELLYLPYSIESMSDNQRFSEIELNRIREAVRKAEQKISGEIVPVFVEKSGHYTIANYKGAVIGFFLFFILIILFDRFFPQWAVYDPLLILLIVSLGGILGAILPQFIPVLKRGLLSRAQLAYETKKRAENAFLQEEVFNTRHRTGIMLFVSFFEHEVIVLADRGISKVVEQKEWDNLVSMITTGISSGKVIEGMEAAISRCGEILTEQGFTKTHDDINELSDDLRVN